MPHQAPLNVAAQDELASLREQMAALKKQHAELQEQLALRDLALDSIPTHFVVKKVTQSGRTTVYCNRAVRESFGYSREELLDRSQPIGVDWTAERFAEARAVMAAGQQFSFEEEVSRKDGSTFWVGVTVTPVFDANGAMTHTMAIGADITVKRESQRKERELQQQLVAEMNERERMLIELRTAQKLESVGRLAAGVAHEINTPIQYVGDSLYFLRSAVADISRLIDTYSTVLGSLDNNPATATARELITSTAASIDLPFLLEEMPKAFERTFEGTTRVADIVRAMKEFSHPDATEFSSADLNHALQTTLTVAANEYKYLASIKTQFAELPPVICNVGELNQVFLNMIVNAAHAIHDAGKDISNGVISISTEVVGDQVQIVFSDNGCGISRENLDKIYDPFFTTKEVGRGTGQGLAITRSIVVDKHGGEVNVSSEMGVGTQFTIRLPLAGRHAAAAAT
jgi:PAS domain S-box-containing protein